MLKPGKAGAGRVGMRLGVRQRHHSLCEGEQAVLMQQLSKGGCWMEGACAWALSAVACSASCSSRG